MESDDGSVTTTSAMHEWGRIFIEGGKKTGRPFTVLEDELQQKSMEQAGVIDILIKDSNVRCYNDVALPEVLNKC